MTVFLKEYLKTQRILARADQIMKKQKLVFGFRFCSRGIWLD